MKSAITDISTEQAVGQWRNGDIVFSIELGGLGPGYEQATNTDSII